MCNCLFIPCEGEIEYKNEAFPPESLTHTPTHADTHTYKHAHTSAVSEGKSHLEHFDLSLGSPRLPLAALSSYQVDSNKMAS